MRNELRHVQADEVAVLPSYIPALLMLAAAPGLAQLAQGVRIWVSGGHYLAFGDGLNLWSGAHLALKGQLPVVFDPALYADWFAARFGGDVHTWSYPPSYLLQALPFGLLPVAAGILCFDIVSVLCLFLALRASRLSWGLAVAVLACPTALTSLSGSQNGALFASLIIAGLFLSEDRPWFGGVLLGLATMKPQLGLLIPVYWVARGNWRAILAAALAAATLILLSAWAFTPQSWSWFADKIMPFMQHVMVALVAKAHGGPRAMIVSSFSEAWQIGLGGAAQYIQAGSTLLAVALAWRLGRAGAVPACERLAWLMLLGVLATPYIWCYDMIPASLGVAILFQQPERGIAARVALAALWAAPGFAPYAAIFGLPSFVPVLILLLLALAWPSRKNRRPSLAHG